jgi:HlyD family secretion protein
MIAQLACRVISRGRQVVATAQRGLAGMAGLCRSRLRQGGAGRARAVDRDLCGAWRSDRQGRTSFDAGRHTGARGPRSSGATALAQAEEQLANLEAAMKPTEVAQAEANLTDARSTLERARADLQRDEALLRTGYATAQSVDQRRADYRSAEAKAQHAEAALTQARAPMGRDREIEAQRAAVAAARAALGMAEWRLAQRTVTAPIGGRVADVMAQPGETMAAGAPVVSILPPDNIFVRFFVPETALSGLHRGDRVSFGCDGCPRELAGTISFISPTAEYTPPVIYSESTRAKLVFRIEARPRPDQAAFLNPGQPIDVRPIRAGAAQ